MPIPNVRTAYKELGTIQSAVLDVMAPLTSIVEADAKGDKITHKQAVKAAKAAIELVRNASSKINHCRRTKIMNKALLPLTEGDENFVDAAPALFGIAFTQRSKELVDQVKAMRSHLPGHKDDKQFFQSVPLNSRGVTSTARSQGIDEITVTEDSNVSCRSRNPSGTHKVSTHTIKFFLITYFKVF